MLCSTKQYASILIVPEHPFSFPCPVGCQRLSFGRGRFSHDVFCSGDLGIRVPDTFPLVTDVCFFICA